MPTSSNKDSVTINGTFFYTMQKAASLLNFKSVRSLSRLVNRRKIRYTRLANRPLFEPKDIEDYIAAHTVQPKISFKRIVK